MEKVKKIREGDVRTATRVIRNLEDNIPEAKTTIKHIFPYTGKAHVIGVTGSPGAGKSTLIDSIIASYREKGKTVGVLLVDPTSPFTGGAILGDRIRLQRHTEDPGVFVRSLATRGALGGLSKAVGDAIHVLDVMGKDVVIVETVGTGQQEVEIINHAHTVIVVLIPGMGDEIQAIKAGIMEIADVFIINKADREGTGKLYRDIMMMLDMAGFSKNDWRPPILRVESIFVPETFKEKVKEVSETIQRHYDHLMERGLLGNRVRRKTLHELNEALRACILEPILNRLVADGELERMADRCLKKETDPYSCAEEIAARCLKDPGA